MSWIVADLFSDKHIVTKQKYLYTATCKAKEAITQKAEEMATLATYAAHLWRQLDFLDHRKETVLWLELECLDLLECSGVQVPESSALSIGSLLFFSNVMGVLDWSSLGLLDTAAGSS